MQEQSAAPQKNAQDSTKSFIDAQVIQTYLRALGKRKSIASIKHNSDAMAQDLSISECLNVLNKFNFKASFGAVNLSELDANWLPLIAFRQNDKPLVIVELTDDKVVYLSSVNKTGTQTISTQELNDTYSGYALTARTMSYSEIKQSNGHWFFSAFAKNKWLYGQVLAAAAVSNFLALTTSIFTMTVYDRIIPNAAIESLYALSVGVGFALLCDFLIKTLRAKFIDIASQRADLSISRRLFDQILKLDLSKTKQKTGTLASTIKEFEVLREFFTSSTLVVIIDLPFVVFFIYVIAQLGGPLYLVPAIAVPVVILVGLIVQPLLSKTAKSTMDSSGNKQAVLVETLNGLETVKTSGIGPLLKKRYQRALIDQSNVGAVSKGWSQLVVNFAASTQQFAQVGIIFYGVFLIRDGVISQGALIAAVILGGRALAPLGQLANVLSRANNARTAYRALSQLFAFIGDNDTEANSISRTDIKPSIEFKNVSFSYSKDGPPLLDNVSLMIPEGQTVGIVGKMGSGKSTFTKLIAGTLQPESGGILLDGVDLRQLDPADKLRNIGVMPQETWLFSGTIRENVQLDFAEYSDDHMLEISKISQLDEYVSKLPEGYDSLLEEKGVGLSGGQKQIICLTRAMLHDPNVLLLDEPTSSLDQNTEKALLENLSDFIKDKTTIIVTHRNSLLTICDRILVIEKGAVIADKTPDELGIQRI